MGSNSRMIPSIVHSSGPIALFGGGKIRSRDWAAVESFTTMVVAADGGASAALDFGVKPAAVIGDMDSIAPAAARAFGDVMHPVAEQDSTDFDKALRHISAPLVLGLGFLGRRIDHQLAAFTVLTRYPEQRCVLVGKHDLVFLAPPQMDLNLPKGSRLSLFPMGAVRGTSTGLEWAIDGLDFAPDGRVGTSNRVNADQQVLHFETPKMLVITPRAALAEVVSGVTSAVPWPALGQ